VSRLILFVLLFCAVPYLAHAQEGGRVTVQHGIGEKQNIDARQNIGAHTPSAQPVQPAVPGAETRKVIQTSSLTATHTGARRPKIAIVIDDMGMQRQALTALAAMKPLTLSFLPYADQLNDQTRRMQIAGHELMLHLPMEPISPFADPGPNALYGNMSVKELSAKLDWNMARFGSFIAVNNHMGSKLTEDPAAMVRVMTALKGRNVFFLDSRTSPNSVAERAARAVGVGFVGRDVFLDNVRTRAAILQQLQKALAIADIRGWSIAIGHPHAVTLATIADWRVDVESLGVEIVPLADVYALESARISALGHGTDDKLAR